LAAVTHSSPSKMNTTLTIDCIILKSAWQAVCRPFSDQFRRLSTLRSGSLCPALAALLLAPLSALNGAEIAPGSKPVNLRCENLVNPLGIDATKPRLSWQMQASDPAARAALTVDVVHHVYDTCDNFTGASSRGARCGRLHLIFRNNFVCSISLRFFTTVEGTLIQGVLGSWV